MSNATQMPSSSAAPSTAPAPAAPRRRWPAWLAAAAVALVAWRLLAGGGEPPSGLRAGRYALDAADLAAAAATAEGRWQAMPPRISLDLAERAGAGLVALPDDRHAAAWREAGSGAEVTQVTLLYDRPDEAAGLLRGRAVGLLADHFGLAVEPAALDGADEAAAWRGPEWRAASARRGGVVVFVAALGDAAPDPLALAGRAMAAVAATPPETATP